MQSRLDFISFQSEKNAVLFSVYWLTSATVHRAFHIDKFFGLCDWANGIISMETKSEYKRKLDSIICSVITADTLNSLRIDKTAPI